MAVEEKKDQNLTAVLGGMECVWTTLEKHAAMGGILLALGNLVRECHVAFDSTAECLIGPWLSLVERLVRDEEVASSNLAGPRFYSLHEYHTCCFGRRNGQPLWRPEANGWRWAERRDAIGLLGV